MSKNIQVTETKAELDNGHIALYNRKILVITYTGSNNTREIETITLNTDISDAKIIGLYSKVGYDGFSYVSAYYDDRTILIACHRGSQPKYTFPFVARIKNMTNETINFEVYFKNYKPILYKYDNNSGTGNFGTFIKTKSKKYNIAIEDSSIIIYTRDTFAPIGVRLLEGISSGHDYIACDIDTNTIILRGHKDHIITINDETKQENCCICLDKKPNIFLFPCGHELCHEHLPSITECPQCRIMITNYIPMVIKENSKILRYLNENTKPSTKAPSPDVKSG